MRQDKHTALGAPRLSRLSEAHLCPEITVPQPPLERLAHIVAALRHPESGCPWDLKQTHGSMTHHLIEEAYEVLDAIEDKDDASLQEELGDLLFQVVFHARLAEERGKFSLDHVIEGISEKMIARHPHVFGDQRLDSPEAVKEAWEIRKQQKRTSLLAGIPRSLPALQRAQRITQKASAVGFDWNTAAEVVGKIDEEVQELKEALQDGDPGKIKDELGDALFALVNLARKLDIQAEEALQGTNQKFLRRFSHVEKGVAARGKALQEASLEEMDDLWNEAKRKERNP